MSVLESGLSVVKMATPHLQPIEKRQVALCCTEGP